MRDSGATARRRGKDLEQAILGAAWEELVDRGWDGFTMEGVARRAGTGKPSIYSRWSNKAALVRAAAVVVAPTVPFPQVASGDLAGDLTKCLRSTISFLDGPFAQALVAVALESQRTRDEASDEDRPQVIALNEIVMKAQQSGDLAPGRVSNRVLVLGMTLVIYHFLTAPDPPTDKDVVEIVDDIWIPALRAAVGSSADAR